MNLELKMLVVGPVATNCYIGINKQTREAFVVDPGDEAAKIAGHLKNEGLKLAGILLTHGHFDHAGAAAELVELCSGSGEGASSAEGIAARPKVYTHEAEKKVLENPFYNLSGGWFGEKETYHADVFLKTDEVFEVAGFQVKTLFTPGHTPGGCSFYIPKEDVVFTGDALFAGSIGRTDFPEGSSATLIRSVRENILPLPGFTKVYPGQGSFTTVDTEKFENPFL